MRCPFCGKGHIEKVMVMPFQIMGYYQCYHCNTALPMRCFKEKEEQNRES